MKNIFSFGDLFSSIPKKKTIKNTRQRVSRFLGFRRLAKIMIPKKTGDEVGKQKCCLLLHPLPKPGRIPHLCRPEAGTSNHVPCVPTHISVLRCSGLVLFDGHHASWHGSPSGANHSLSKPKTIVKLYCSNLSFFLVVLSPGFGNSRLKSV